MKDEGGRMKTQVMGNGQWVMGIKESEGFCRGTVLVPMLLINTKYSNIIFHQLYFNHKVI
jgi:hypothetical protein